MCIEERPDLSPDPTTIAIIVQREHDPYFSWDGDGSDPRDEGFTPYNVTVKAITVRAGRLIESSSTLGGSYFKHTEPIGDIHGYLPQMVEEAIDGLAIQLQP